MYLKLFHISHYVHILFASMSSLIMFLRFSKKNYIIGNFLVNASKYNKFTKPLDSSDPEKLTSYNSLNKKKQQQKDIIQNTNINEFSFL